ncbi:MAG: hypothetical protein HY744_08690 [Deltaproteobacteria bacterium]|nr:hypothetical protein [Deltaproteobacteria bacterium]
MLPRRRLLGALLGAALLSAGRRATAAPDGADYEVRELEIEGDRALARRVVLLVPGHLGPDERVPLLVALHGLGETGDERSGAYAWLERYGLGSAYERLRRPPLRELGKRGDFAPGRLAEVAAMLVERPFRGLCVACPYTPNVYRAPRREPLLDRYSRWLVEAVLPRVRNEAPVYGDAAHTSLDGCSLGGYVGLEVFLRQTEHFGAWGSVQGAIAAQRIPGYVALVGAAFARLGPRPIHLVTSGGDPYRAVNVAFAGALRRAGIACDLVVGRGPHDQPWLREAGAIEMLLWHDRLAP